MTDVDYTFDLRITPSSDRTPAHADYVCRRCEIEEHGGGLPNPGLYSRMKAHLREAHGEAPNVQFKIVHTEVSSTTARVDFSREAGTAEPT